MNILITAPNLNSKINVSGISTVVKTIIEHNIEHKYFHFEIGKKDKKKSFYVEIIKLILRIVYFSFFLKKNNIDLIHQNIPFDFKGIFREFIINKISIFFKIKIISHIHGGKFLFENSTNLLLRFCIKSILNGSEKVIVLSELEKNILSINYSFNNSIVLSNSIKIQNQALVKTFSKVPVFLFLGRIHLSKGVFEIIDMFKKLNNDFEFKFLMFGDGPLKQQVINELELILGDRFIYGGVVSENNKMNAISKADYFLLPSRFGEGLPMSLLESMSLGLIPIVSNDGSMNSFIQDGVNGIKVKKYDANDLYLKICNIVTNHKLQLEISENAIKTITDYHDINEYVKVLNTIYE